MKKIKCDLSLKGTYSIDNAIKKVDLYTKDLEAKINLFLRRLGAVGISVINANGSYNYDHNSINIGTSFVVESYGGGVVKGTIYAEGEGILFVEFGAGVKYNSKPSSHPKGAELGMIIGAYVNEKGECKGHGNEEYWCYYDEEADEWRTNSGIKAQMPVYKASLEIVRELKRIANEVFMV